MMAGHTMLKVFGAFVVALGFLGGWAPLAFMVAFTGLEILVAFLQAYVFAILTCIYLNDALHMHHISQSNQSSFQGRDIMDPSAAKLIGAGLASIALVGAGVGIGTIFGNYLQGALRNPSAAPGAVRQSSARLRACRGHRPVRPGGGADHPVRVLGPPDPSG